MSRIERRQQQELEKLRRKEAKGSSAKRPSIKRIIGIVALVLVLVAGVALAASYFYVNSKLDKIEEMPTESDVESFADYDLSCVDVDGYVNILILGVDARDMNDVTSTDLRSDAIMIASIKESTGDVYLTSIYRDTFLKMGNDDFYDKVTHAFTYGGVRESIVTINQALDLNIKNYVIFNFNAAADVVDAMGGLELDIEEYEIEELNYYTEETWDICGREGRPKTIIAPGTQLVDGCTAVSYGRIRKNVGDDYKRTERMRILVSKMLEKVKTLGFKDINKLLDIGLPQIKTNLSNSDIMGLAFKSLNFRITGTTGFPYKVVDGFVGDVSYVFPENLYDDVVKLHGEFFGQSSYKPSATVIDISDTILKYLEGADDSPSDDYIEEDGDGYGGTATWGDFEFSSDETVYDDSSSEGDYSGDYSEGYDGGDYTYEEPSYDGGDYGGEVTYEEPTYDGGDYTYEEPTYEEGFSEGEADWG